MSVEIVLDPVETTAVVVASPAASPVQVHAPTSVGVFEISESTRVAVVDGVLYIDEEPP